MKIQVFDATRTREDMESIADELRDLLQLLPTETFLRVRIAGVVSNYLGRPQEAIEVLQAGLMIDPLADDLHNQLGTTYVEMKRFDEARAALMRSLELAPGNPNIYADLSDVEMELNNLSAGLDWMRQATAVDPQDHELASHIAKALYSLELPEEGERWYARVQALAPGSDVARSMEVYRALARKETERAIELASAAISDRIGMRHNAFADVALNYAMLMLEADRAPEAYDYFVSLRPEVADYERLAGDVHGMVMQWVSFYLLADFESFEYRKTAWQAFSTQLDAMGFPWRNDPANLNHTTDFLLTGELDKAIEHYLEHRLAQPLARNLLRHKRPFYPLYGPIYDDPRVAARLDDEARRYALVREEVREMLLRPEWQQ